MENQLPSYVLTFIILITDIITMINVKKAETIGK